MAHQQIAAFARLAKAGDTPNRAIAGQATKLSRGLHGLAYDEVHDEIFVGNPFAQAILVFRGAAEGNEAPIRVIQGPHTELWQPDTLEIDLVHDEIVVPGRDGILVFPRAGNGDVAPLRVLRFDEPNWRAYGVAVDPVHNVIVAGASYGPRPQRKTSLLIFDRSDNGNVKPLRIINGRNTGLQGIRQIQVYPKEGWIIVAQITDGNIMEPEGTFVGVWSVHDNGDVPPRWKIEGGKQNTVMKKPRGVVLNPKHKELIVSDMRLNAVLTYYFPEIF